MTCAILALQGAFAEHAQKLRSLGEDVIELRQARDLDRSFDRLVLPGGESTVQRKLLGELDMLEPLRARIRQGIPVMGTCAGLILLAQEICPSGEAGAFATLPIAVERNAYGRQLGSFHAQAPYDQGEPVPLSFIRAPAIVELLDDEVEVLCQVEGAPVAVRYRNQLALAFHPELDRDDRIHRSFLEMPCL
ncbi:MAG: pyridoxal 5'-phosphate synthase glutaminase subunit PdxT [Eggerthellaceae bacterium]